MADDKCRIASNDVPFEARSISRFSNAFSGASSAVSEPMASQTSPVPAGEAEHAPVGLDVTAPALAPIAGGANCSGTGSCSTSLQPCSRRWGAGVPRAGTTCQQPGPSSLVANHLSFLDVFLLGIAVRRPLNFVARSSLFFPVLGFLIHSMAHSPSSARGWVHQE